MTKIYGECKRIGGARKQFHGKQDLYTFPPHIKMSNKNVKLYLIHCSHVCTYILQIYNICLSDKCRMQVMQLQPYWFSGTWYAR